MLVDVILFTGAGEAPVRAPLAAVLGADRKTERIAKGVYNCPHFNFNLEYDSTWPDGRDNYPYLTHRVITPATAPCSDAPNVKVGGGGEGEHFCYYGVADSYRQIVEMCRELQDDHPVPYCLVVHEVRKKDQPEEGGWRWDNWGDYIGVQTPTCEYLYDEPLIETVWYYRVYKVKPTSIAPDQRLTISA